MATNQDVKIKITGDSSGIEKAVSQAKSSLGELAKSYDFTKGAIAGLIGLGSANALIGTISSAIEAKARLHDLSTQTGISVEGLASLGKVARYSNTELVDVAGASNKLSKALFTQNEDSAGAAAAIRRLG